MQDRDDRDDFLWATVTASLDLSVNCAAALLEGLKLRPHRAAAFAATLRQLADQLERLAQAPDPQAIANVRDLTLRFEAESDEGAPER